MSNDSSGERSPARVLVADDDVHIRELMRAVLGRDFSVTITPDAESALAMLASGENFDVLISDYILPGMSGLDFIRTVRREKYCEGVAILMVSGNDVIAMADRARAAGADAYLPKPFNLADLRAVVKSLHSK